MRPFRSRPLFLYVLSLILLVQVRAFAQAAETGTAPSAGDEKRLAIAKDVMEQFAHGDLATIRERFSDELRSAVTASDVKDVHDEIVDVCGPFQAQISQTARVSQGEQVYVAKSQFTRYKVELRLTFDDANAITDFRIGPVSDMDPEAMEAAARAIADALRQQQFTDVYAKFNPRMKEAMPAERLEASWGHVQTHLGPFKSIRSAKKDPDADRVDVRCDFQNGQMIVRIAYDPEGKISGLWMLPAEPEKDSQT